MGATTVTARIDAAASSSVAMRRANVVLPAPGVADGEEVARAAAEVGREGLLLPGAQLRGGTPRRPLGEGGREVSGG